MASQPLPSITDDDVQRIVLRDFAAIQVAEVLTVLDEYGEETWHREPARVRIAALKLAAGCLDRLRNQIAIANVDYRDVLTPAEFPKYNSKRVVELDKLPLDEVQRIIDADWEQYQEWLTR